MNISMFMKHIFVTIIFAFSGVCINQSYGQETNHINEVIGPETNGMQLIISTTNDTFQIGQRISMDVELKNVSSNAASVKIDDALSGYHFKIIGTKGEKLPINKFGLQWFHPWIMYMRTFENVDPGKTIGEEIPISMLYDITNTGQYTVNVSMNFIDRKVAFAGPLKFSIVEPKN